MKNFFKRIFYLLQQFDGIWSVPAAFITFYFVGQYLQEYLGVGVGTYDPGFIQPLFLAAAIVIGSVNIATVGMYFTFRGLFRYIWGRSVKCNCEMLCTCPKTAKEDFKQLTIGQRFLLAFGAFAFLIAALIVVYLKLV